MKTVLLALLLVSSCLAFSLKHKAPEAKRETNKRDTVVCQTVTESCSTIGGACTPTCDDCQNNFITCQSLAGFNNTQLCNCYITYVNCAAAKKSDYYNCDSVSVQQECQSTFAFYGNCSCGTAYTGPLMDQECSSGYCSNTSKCTAYKTSGQSCSSDDECGDSSSSIFQTAYVCNATNQCQQLNYYYPGDPCSSNSDCAFYLTNSLGCVSGICASQSVGATCPLGLGICGGGLYCADDNTCQKMVGIGGSCNSTALNNACPNEAYCDAGVCVAPQTKQLGQSCVDTMECVSPNYCSMTTNTCAKPLATPSCTSNTYCTGLNADYVGCICNPVTGSATCETESDPTSVSQYLQCKSQTDSALSCLQAHGCSDLFVTGGCAQVHCQSQIDCYYDCYAKEETVCINYNSQCTSSGAIVSVAWALVAGIFAALMF